MSFSDFDAYADPFPKNLASPVAAQYRDALHLVRFPQALMMRNGRDPRYILARPYTVTLEQASGALVVITVPAGMMTDLATVPRLLRPFVGRVGRHLEAAVVHDYLYSVRHLGPESAQRRRFADDTMLAMMLAASVPLARQIYWAVRVFGAIFASRRQTGDLLDLSVPTYQRYLV